jgi:hypothetical protein
MDPDAPPPLSLTTIDLSAAPATAAQARDELHVVLDLLPERMLHALHCTVRAWVLLPGARHVPER